MPLDIFQKRRSLAGADLEDELGTMVTLGAPASQGATQSQEDR